MRLTVKLIKRGERQVGLEDKYLMIFLCILLSLPLRLAWKRATVNEICRINKHRSCFIQFKEKQDLNYMGLNSESEHVSCRF